jgi:hypothetical protein
MTQKHSEKSGSSPRPWFWGIQAYHDKVPDGPYAKNLEKFAQNYQNGSGTPPSDARMDLFACNLALSMKNIST